MAGTKAGGIAAAAKTKKLYGNDFYKRIGSKGGKLSTTGGYYKRPDLARKNGAIGGSISRRVAR